MRGFLRIKTKNFNIENRNKLTQLNINLTDNESEHMQLYFIWISGNSPLSFTILFSSIINIQQFTFTNQFAVIIRYQFSVYQGYLLLGVLNLISLILVMSMILYQYLMHSLEEKRNQETYWSQNHYISPPPSAY